MEPTNLLKEFCGGKIGVKSSSLPSTELLDKTLAMRNILYHTVSKMTNKPHVPRRAQKCWRRAALAGELGTGGHHMSQLCGPHAKGATAA